VISWSPRRRPARALRRLRTLDDDVGRRDPLDAAEHGLDIGDDLTDHVLVLGHQREPHLGAAFVDLDLAGENLPAGTRLAIGSAVIEVTDQPHTGCGKFVQRFGVDAMKFVNSSVGRALNLRGINARVVQPGVIRVGDVTRKLLPRSE